MIIHASTKSKAWKRGADKALTKANGKECSLSDIVGKLELNAHNAADVNLLTQIYNHLFGVLDKNQKGKVTIFDAKGKEVLTYGYKV